MGGKGDGARYDRRWLDGAPRVVAKARMDEEEGKDADVERFEERLKKLQPSAEASDRIREEIEKATESGFF